MVECDPADAVRQALQVVLPAVLGVQVHLGIVVQGLQHRVDDAVQQVLPAGDVPVQGHRLDPEERPEPAHGQLVQALLVDELDGRRRIRRLSRPLPPPRA